MLPVSRARLHDARIGNQLLVPGPGASSTWFAPLDATPHPAQCEVIAKHDRRTRRRCSWPSLSLRAPCRIEPSGGKGQLSSDSGPTTQRAKANNTRGGDERRIYNEPPHDPSIASSSHQPRFVHRSHDQSSSVSSVLPETSLGHARGIATHAPPLFVLLLVAEPHVAY